MTIAKLKQYIKKSPDSPGIYIFKKRGDFLYIGKASNIKKRLASYPRTQNIRISKMLDQASSLSYKITPSEIEALILESQYIKKYKPTFNIVMRDGKQYSYVGFTKDQFPKIFVTHQPFDSPPNSGSLRASLAKGQMLFVGPFTDAGALKTTLRLLRKIFPYCTCKQKHNNYCLNYHIDKCLGVCCLKEVSSIKYQVLRDYKRNIKAINDILGGKRRGLIKKLEKEMLGLGDKKKYEEAIDLQKKIGKLKRVFENARILRDTNIRMHSNDTNALRGLKRALGFTTLPRRIEGYDISNIQGTNATGSMVVFSDGSPDKGQYRKFKIRMKNKPNDTAMLKEIIARRLKHEEWPYPDLILVDGGRGQLNATATALKDLRFKNIDLRIIALTKNKKHKGIKIFVSGKKNAIDLNKLPIDVKSLILYIDAEAHRFAINYYRRIHKKTALSR